MSPFFEVSGVPKGSYDQKIFFVLNNTFCSKKIVKAIKKFRSLFFANFDFLDKKNLCKNF